MKIKIKKSLKEIDDTQPPMGEPPDPSKFEKDQEESRADKFLRRMADERAERAREYYDHVKTLEPAKLEPMQKDLGFDEDGYPVDIDRSGMEPYDPDKDPLGPLQEVARRHFPKR